MGLSTTTSRHVWAVQTQEEELQSQLYFMNLGGLKDTALDMGPLRSFRTDQLSFVFPQMILK